MAITQTSVPQTIFQPTTEFAFLVHSSKSFIYLLGMNTGSDGQVTLGKPGLYFATTLNSNDTNDSAFYYTIGAAASSSTAHMAFFVMPKQPLSFWFRTTESAAILHGIQSSGSNTNTLVTMVG